MGIRCALGIKTWVTIGAVLLLCACGQAADPSGEAGAENGVGGEVVLNRGNGAEPNSLDPHRASGTWESNIIGDMIVGLLTDDAEGKPIPGAAEQWEVSDDGLTWTFFLRDHTWSDGVPVTAEDFVFAWQRILNPETAAAYASILYVFKNAEAINSGEMPPEALGARAIDAQTLELQLENPAPYLTEMLTHFTTYPVPRHAAEVHGDAWTRAGNYVGNGPYVLSEWVLSDQVTLVKNPLFYDAENVQIDRVVFYPTTDAMAALNRFRAGELDTQDPLPSQQIDWLRSNMPEAVHIEPYLGVSYTLVNHERPPFDDVRVREALNLAYDRETVTEQVIRLGAPPAYGIVPPGVANYPGGNELSFRDLPYAERIARAQSLMQEAGYGPDNRLVTTLSTTTSPDSRRIAAVIQQMWQQVYIDVEVVNNDVQIHYLKLQEGDFDIGGAGWIGDFNDARNFLFLLMTDNGGLNYGRYNNPAFDEVIRQSDEEQDLVTRGELLAEAERIALDDFAWIPTRYVVTTNLVHPYVKGWITNISDVNRTRWLSLER